MEVESGEDEVELELTADVAWPWGEVEADEVTPVSEAAAVAVVDSETEADVITAVAVRLASIAVDPEAGMVVIPS